MTATDEEASEPAAGVDALAEVDALVDAGRRAPGSDAERRAARHLEQRLADLGRPSETEGFAVHQAWPLSYAILAGLAVAGSLLSVSVPVAGAALALAAALLTFLEASSLVPTLRRLLGRRASQNVVSWSETGKPGALVLVAHCDAGRAGIAHSDRTARRRVPIGGLQLLFWAELAVLACSLARLAGFDGTPLTAVQFVPTVVLIAGIALLTDVALAGTKGGENDNASGAALVLRLAERFGGGLEHFDVHVVFTGAQKAGAAGMRDFLRRHGGQRLDTEATVFLNVDEVGSGSVRYTRREGALVTVASHVQLLALCDETDAEPLVSRSASDAYAARAAGFPAITVTCRERRDYASGRVDEQALERAESFCADLIERLDAEVGPGLSRPTAP
ncbi:MAG: hypothetical protein QOH58_2157 [Thermoleophilaceae bacterium]|jgi:hypothetical protein|nr:hypothetical protein [Thermoleophilaceae bacterium]